MRLQRSEGVKLGDVVYVRYLDHVLFKNVDPNLIKPGICEATGWLQKEDERAIWIVWWRPVNQLPHERPSPAQSGVVILKSDILEMRRIT